MIVRETCGGPTPGWGKRRTGLDFLKKWRGEDEDMIPQVERPIGARGRDAHTYYYLLALIVWS
jgi:hypothetical protein